MKRLPPGLGVLMAFGAMALVQAQAELDNEELPLPQWSEEDLRAMRDGTAMNPLLNNHLWPQNEAALLAEEAALADTPDSQQPTAELSRFLPPHLLASPGAGRPSLPPAFVQTPATAMREVSVGFMTDARAWSAEQYLIDPGGQLSETYQEDFSRFLEFHAQDAAIRLHVLLLGRDERLPADANMAAIAQGSLVRGRACLAVVPHGEPWRLRLFLSRELHKVASPAELTAVLEDSVRDAMLATDQDEQIHRLLVRLSIRLFWLERLLPENQPKVPVAGVVAANRLAATPAMAPEDLALPEIISPALTPTLTHQGWPWTIAALSLLLAGFVAWRWQVYKLRHFVWTLPGGQTIAPRLGGAQCGGGTWVDYR